MAASLDIHAIQAPHGVWHRPPPSPHSQLALPTPLIFSLRGSSAVAAPRSAISRCQFHESLNEILAVASSPQFRDHRLQPQPDRTIHTRRVLKQTGAVSPPGQPTLLPVAPGTLPPTARLEGGVNGHRVYFVRVDIQRRATAQASRDIFKSVCAVDVGAVPGFPELLEAAKEPPANPDCPSVSARAFRASCSDAEAFADSSWPALAWICVGSSFSG